MRSGSDDSELFRLLSQKREAFEGGGTNSAVDSPGSRQGIYRRLIDTVPRRGDVRDGSVRILRGNSRSEAVIEKLFWQTCGNGTLPLFEYRLRNGSRIPEFDEIPYRKGSGDEQRVDFRLGHRGRSAAFGVFDFPVDADSVLMERGIRKKLERDGSEWINFGSARCRRHPLRAPNHLPGRLFPHGQASEAQSVPSSGSRPNAPVETQYARNGEQ